ncbi:hypothetical protein GO613_03580 [Azoarcus communis]|uniref:Uncharacterized protein n=1 Tax=Parazoarcus communis SWub3 = DSM 12120 TaxID=1121029 RepID=A0A323UXK4_9RHOO|nr:cytochrome oxidase putative small subunit CydP [Parazoarcus communis]NMG47181.1 hypothetical protein [Parazoarcus communis]NMG70369.1 hypothetical protein [Parazoarcus communis SWub3 = DSM 12120]PZA17205.1 hypothetical protein DNK49_08200 [Azoarcus communis] [Parazoarcus communis SWub3 = DSM 12120]
MSLPPPRLTDRRLVRDLVWVVILKLIVITALWWGFVREFRVPVDHDAMAVQLAAPLPAKQQTHTDGEPHGQ